MDFFFFSPFLQRLWQNLTSFFPTTTPTETGNLASIFAGPGNAKPMHGPKEKEKDVGSNGTPASREEDATTATMPMVTGVTSFRINNKDRTFIDEIAYKGWTFKMGDYVHLVNPDDPAKPVVGQIFKPYITTG